MRTRHVEGAFENTLAEIAGEKAAALRRIGERLQSLCGDLAVLFEQLPPPGHPEREAQVERYRALRAEARRWRWYMEVQREALGLRAHRDLDRYYPVPPPVRP